MADEQQAGAGCTAFVEQQAQKTLAAVGIERRGRFIGDHQFRLADQRTSRGDPLLLADGERVGAALEQRRGQPEMLEQPACGLLRTAVSTAGTLPAQAREAAGQGDVGAYREERQEVELLEDEAGVIDPPAVAGCGAEAGQVAAEQADVPAVGHMHATDQAQQRALAAARRAFEKHPFTLVQTQLGDVQQLGLPGPGEMQVVDLEDGRSHGVFGGHRQNSRVAARRPSSAAR